MALLATRPDVDAALLVTGAAEKAWSFDACRRLSETSTDDVVNLCALRYPTGSERLVWDWMLGGGASKYPTRTPARIHTELIAEETIRQRETYKLRAIRVTSVGDEWVP